MEQEKKDLKSIGESVLIGLSRIKELENAKRLIETSDTIMFTTPERQGKEIVTIEGSEDTKPIIDVAKELAMKYIENKIVSLEEAVYQHIV